MKVSKEKDLIRIEATIDEFLTLKKAMDTACIGMIDLALERPKDREIAEERRKYSELRNQISTYAQEI